MASELDKIGNWLWSVSIIVGVYSAFFWMVDEARYGRLRYAIQYGVGYSHVKESNKPHNCDWLTAPIGNKNCHYDPQVVIIRTGKNTSGERIWSWDDGKTWWPDDQRPPAEAGVIVTWQKIDDENPD